MDHAHDHHAVAHGSPAGRALAIAFALTCLMLVIEAAGGVISGSLALLADAGHMLVDAASLLLAWAAAHFASRPADARRSFGYARLEVLAGFVNALVQVLLVAWIVYEAVRRLVNLNETEIRSGVMLGVALAGLLANGIVLRMLHARESGDLNTAAASLHVFGDLLGSLATVAAALLVRYLDWAWADPALSLVVSLLILRGAWQLLYRSSHILLEGVPEGVRTEDIRAALAASNAAIVEVHHVHVWLIASGSRMATLHARLCDGSDTQAQLRAIKRVLRERFAIDHATVEIELGECADEASDCAPGETHHH
ncbi:MAG TPA: cation diffusion facilitator family transporter [Rhodanobacteraceae bacterium]|nr:cation diffusion facilitator family transporter [Rhodanobacteraceae bacterium]